MGFEASPEVVSDSPHLRGDPQVGDVALLALQLAGPLHVLLRLPRRGADGVKVAVLFDGEAGDGLAGLGDALDHAIRPGRLDADDHYGGDVGVRAGADERVEVQIEVGAELQAAVGMWDGQRALDVVAHGLAGGVGNVVQRKDDDVVPHARAAVFAAISEELFLHGYHLFVLRL